MDTNERFNQIESLLIDLMHKVERQGEAIARQEQRLDDIGEQIGDIINILKLSEARHTETDKRQETIMAEIKKQSQRQDVVVEALRALLKRQETTDSRLDSAVQTQLQMLQLMRLNSDKTDEQEPRIKRLEDEVFRAAS